ncbi:MAG: translocation/assembly module TamB domain-containing protein [Chlamydiae bacterium]|nr:translocation/assembly module TamB domain-containing protein [Chlamydiota bacterium]
MKNIFAILCLLFLTSIALIQTPWGKNKIKEWVVKKAKQEGIELEIGKIEGKIPIEWIFHDVKINSIKMERISIRISPLTFLKRNKILFSYVKIDSGNYGPIPFDLTSKLTISFKKKSIRFSHFTIENSSGHLSGFGRFNFDLSPKKGIFSISCEDLSLLQPLFPYQISGSLFGSAMVRDQELHFDGKGVNFQLQNYTAGELDLHTKIQFFAHGIRSLCDVETKDSYLPFKGFVNLEWNHKEKMVVVHECSLQGEETSIWGRFKIETNFSSMDGDLYVQSLDLRHFRNLFHDSLLSGNFGGRGHFSLEEGKQNLFLHGNLKNFRSNRGAIQDLTFKSEVKDLWQNPEGKIEMEISQIEVGKTAITNANFYSIISKGKNQFRFFSRGNCISPFEINMQGSWNWTNHDLAIDIQDLSGFGFRESFFLMNNLKMNISKNKFATNQFHLNHSDGQIYGKIALTSSLSKISLNGTHIPLEFITLFHPNLPIQGRANIECDLTSNQNSLQGVCLINFERVEMQNPGKENSFSAKGKLQMHFDQNIVQFHGQMKTQELELLDYSATIPLTHRSFPFLILFDQNRPFSAELTAECKLQNIADFINIGGDRLEGWIFSHLIFSKTLKSPFIQGKIELEKGIYENDFTGMSLKNISAKAVALNQKIELLSFSANDDQGEGKVEAKGNFVVDPTLSFPYSIEARIERFQTISFDNLVGQFTGNLHIQGDLHSAKATGELKLDRADFKISDISPISIPQLPITFVNIPHHLESSTAPIFFPLHLDVTIQAPEKAFVEGKGLHSEWKGELHIGGTHTEPTASGKLNLVKGEFLFWGKVFNFTEGEMLFNDTVSPKVYFSLGGTCSLPECIVTVILKGPISSPTLTFKSNPQMATSSILSRILFNKDIAEISPIQAIQLTQTILSLSGKTAPDILEKIRKTLGIDRLNISTSENDPSKISIQIGKYLMRGVLLSLVQEADTRNIVVEVELIPGFNFQAEMGEKEQGKFSLKWHHLY